jgi:hypothetical protein
MHRRYVKNPEGSPKQNPPLFTDIAEFVIPGFAGFAVTRFATHVAATQIERVKPSWGKHAGAGVSIGAFLATWLLIHRVKFLQRHHTPAVVGSAIAAIQSLLQLYFPRLGWVVSDATHELAMPQAAPAMTASDQMMEQMQLRPVDDDPNEYTYNDSFDAGRYGAQHDVPPKPGKAADDLSDLELDLGVFKN